MVQRAKIIIENFDNGYGIHWQDADNEAQPVNKVATLEDVDSTIGDMIMQDVSDLFDKTACGKVLITIDFIQTF